MTVEVAERDGVRFLTCTGRVADPLSLITSAIENRSERVLLDAGDLPESFTDLRSGVAGEFVQKMVNYKIRVAAVFGDDADYPERFREFLREARTNPVFRPFSDRSDAEAWLCGS
jgi:hypothetical protein